MRAATTAPKYYPTVETLAHLVAGEWREIAVRGDGGGVCDEWVSSVPNHEFRELAKLRSGGRVTTTQYRAPDGAMRLLAMLVPQEHVGKFASDAHLRSRDGALRPRGPQNRIHRVHLRHD